MNKAYIEWAKNVESVLKARYGRDMCYDRAVFKAVYADNVAVEEAVERIAPILIAELEANRQASAKHLNGLAALVERAVNVK